MKKLLKILCLLLIFTAGVGMTEMKVQAENGDGIINVDDSCIYGTDRELMNLTVDGTLVISNNVTVKVTGDLTIGATGKVTIENSGSLIVNGKVTINQQSTTLEENGATVINRGKLYINGTLSAEGTENSEDIEGSDISGQSNENSNLTKLSFTNNGTIYLDGSKGAQLLINSSKYNVDVREGDSSVTNQGEYWYVDTSSGLDPEASYIECVYAEELDFSSYFDKTSPYKFKNEKMSGWNVNSDNNPNQLTIQYTPDSDIYTSLELWVSVKLKKADITDYPEAQKSLVAVYGQTLKDITLPAGFVFVNPNQSVGDVGELHTFYVNYADLAVAQNYNDLVVTVKVNPASITDYSGGVLTAIRGQKLKDVKLPAGFAFVNPSADVGAVGDHTFAINYSDGNKAKNYNNKNVTVRVLPSQGDNVVSEINGMDVSSANLDMNKINSANQMIARYDALPASEKEQVPATTVQKLEAIRKLVNNQAKCGAKVYWRYSGGTLTIFGQGAMYDYFNKYNSKTLQKDVAGRTYQSCAATANTIVIEDGVSRIGRGAFAYFTKATKVVVNGQNTRCVIGQAAFSCCSKLKTVSLKGVTKIEFSGFSKCTSLTKITLPEGLSVLDKSTFLQCKKLKTVSLPTTLKSVGAAVFFDCRKLKTITVRSNIKKCGADVFYCANKKCKVVCGKKAAQNCKFVKKAAKAGLKIKKK